MIEYLSSESALNAVSRFNGAVMENKVSKQFFVSFYLSPSKT